MKPLLFKIQILLFFASLISSEEIGIGQQKCEGPTCIGEGIAVETILKENLNSGEKETVETPDLDHNELDSKSADIDHPVIDKILPELAQTDEIVNSEVNKDIKNEETLNVVPLLKESEVDTLGLDEETKSRQSLSFENSESNDIVKTNIESNDGSQIEQEASAQIVNHGYPDKPNSQIVVNDQAYAEGQNKAYVQPNQEYHGHSNDHLGHGDFGHSHTHPSHSHDQGHGHHGHSHDQGHGQNVHSQDHEHGHSHSHGHGHSHDHGEDHDHSHGIGHLGRGVHKKVPEEIPQHYKPAAQNYDLPLSAQFGTPSPYNNQYYEPSIYPMEPPPVYDNPNQYPNSEQPATELNKVQDSFLHENYEQVNNVQQNKVQDHYLQEKYVQENYIQENYVQESYGQENYIHQEPSKGEINANNNVEDSHEIVNPTQTVLEQNYDHSSPNLYEGQNEVERPQIETSSETLTQEDDLKTQVDKSSTNFGQTHSSSFIPEWLHLMAHENGGLNGDRIALVFIISVTILVIYLINTFMDQSTRERPLIRRLAEMDKKLFKTTNELLILQSERTKNGGSPVGEEANTEIIRELQLELEQARLELETSRWTVRKEGDRSNIANIRLEEAQQEVLNAQEEARQVQEMVEEMLANQKDQNGGSDDKLMEVVHQLQSQLESQKDMLLKYEPKLKKKEKENKELTKQMKQMRADVANANLETDKLKKELSETTKIKEDSTRKLEEIGNNEDEWKSLSDLLQTQLEEKSEKFANTENELTSLKSRLSVFTNESESKDEQMEILKETIKELRSRKMATEEEDGWEVEGVGWNDKEVAVIKDVAMLKVENRKMAEEKESLDNELCQLKQTFNETSAQLVEFKSEAESLREVRDEVVNQHNEVQRKLDVLTEFFNKKEAELQKQLGLQSARFGDANTDAESTARKLISVSSELGSTQDQLKILKGELDDQERSLKASVAGQEKKAHENWVAARQAERKLTELQGEMSILRNRLTIVESKNNLLEQEKGDLEGTVTMLKNNVKPEPVADLRASASVENLSKTTMETFASGLNFPTSPESLPPLPGLPGMPSAMPGMSLLTSPLAMAPSLFQTGTMLPGMLDIRPPPLGRMSPGPRDRNRGYTSRSPSPEYNSYRGSGKRGGRDNRDASPSSRSERRQSPARRGPSPTRSDRGYRDSSRRQYEGDYSRDKDRHYKTRDRDASPDRYSERSEYSGRESQKYRQDRPENK